MEKKTIYKILFIAAVVGGGIWAWKKFGPKKQTIKSGAVGYKKVPTTATTVPDSIRKTATVGGVDG